MGKRRGIDPSLKRSRGSDSPKPRRGPDPPPSKRGAGFVATAEGPNPPPSPRRRPDLPPQLRMGPDPPPPCMPPRSLPGAEEARDTHKQCRKEHHMDGEANKGSYVGGGWEERA